MTDLRSPRSAIDGPPSPGATGPSARPWPWGRAHLLLLGLVLATVTSSIALERRITRIYADATGLNQQWTDRVNQYVKLRELAAAVVKPIDQGVMADDRAAHAAPVTNAETTFAAAIRELEADVPDARPGVPSPDTDLIRTQLARIRQHMDDIVKAGRAADDAGRQGDHSLAARHRAEVHVELARLNAAITVITTHLRAFQTKFMQEELARADGLALWVYPVAGLVLVVLALHGVYTWRLSAKMRRVERERDRSAATILHLSSFPESNPNPIIEIDGEGRIVYSNPAVQATLDRLGLAEPAALLPADLTDLLGAARAGTQTQFYRELDVGDRALGQYLHYLPQFGSMRLYTIDISERRRLERAQRDDEAKLRAVFENAPLPMILVDGQCQVRRANAAATRLSGDPEQAMVGKRGGAALHCVHHLGSPGGCGTGEACKSCAVRHAVLQSWETEVAHSKVETQVNLMLKGQVCARTVLLSTTPLRAGDERLVLVCLEDVTERRQAEELLRTAAQTDKLTGLPNRAVLHEQIAQAMARTAADPAYGYALLFLDFDRFKIINDSLGHEAGDQLLREMANRLRGFMTAGAWRGAAGDRPVVARLGGDEFTVLLSGLGHAVQAVQLAERLERELSRPYTIQGHQVVSTVSTGITTSDVGYQRAEDVIRDADTAMYQAKTAGKARHALFDRAMHEQVRARMQLETDLRRAIERGEIRVHYQPIIVLESGLLWGFEALARWNHPERGPVSPEEFIPIAEETGLILSLGEIVIREAVRQAAAWQHRVRSGPPPHMNVNLSRRQLVQPELAQVIRGALEQTALDPARLHLEITETTIMTDAKAAAVALDELKALGVGLEMDDFGIGHSSLSCLHQFPLDGLKIDRSFVRNMAGRPDYAAVVHAIVTLAHNLGMRVTAEGVENTDQVVQLQALECDHAQGYLFARPMDAQAAGDFVEQRTALPRSA